LLVVQVKHALRSVQQVQQHVAVSRRCSGRFIVVDTIGSPPLSGHTAPLKMELLAAQTLQSKTIGNQCCSRESEEALRKQSPASLPCGSMLCSSRKGGIVYRWTTLAVQGRCLHQNIRVASALSPSKGRRYYIICTSTAHASK
jgi:hypothetical protein